MAYRKLPRDTRNKITEYISTLTFPLLRSPWCASYAGKSPKLCGSDSPAMCVSSIHNLMEEAPPHNCLHFLVCLHSCFMSFRAKKWSIFYWTGLEWIVDTQQTGLTTKSTKAETLLKRSARFPRTDKEKTLQQVSARTLATLRAFVKRQISPKQEPSLKEVATCSKCQENNSFCHKFEIKKITKTKKIQIAKQENTGIT